MKLPIRPWKAINKQDWDGEDESHYAGQHDEKGPIFPRMTPGLPEVALQQHAGLALHDLVDDSAHLREMSE